MDRKPTYEELEQRIEELEREAGASRTKVSGINIEWNANEGTCTFEDLPVAMMWVDTTLAGLMSGVQSMVGTERFSLSLQSEGRKSVEEDWKVISQFSDFEEGFKAIANIAAVAGWGDWKLTSFDKNKLECCFRVKNSWEGRYQKSLGVCWGSGMLAGKMAGYCSKLFRTNCWAKQTIFIADGDDVDEFIVAPSERLIESEIENLLLTDEATRADMAVALQKLRGEVNERKQAEEALRESESRYSALFTGITDAVFVHHITEDGEPGRIIDANLVACKMLGYTRDELIGMGIGDIDAPESVVDVCHVVDNLKAGRSVLFEQVHVAKDGRRIPVEVHTKSFEYNGRLAILSTVRDITDRKLAEKEKMKLELRLRQAQKMEAIGTLAGGIAHDFNNMLGIILGNIEIALDDVPEWNPARYNLEEVRTASLRAKDVVRQLMSFARKTKIEKKPTNITPIVKESLKMLRVSIPASIDIRHNISENIGTILANPTQINRILINLCTNAHHAISDDGIIDVTLENILIDEGRAAQHPELRPGKFVHLIVRDTGQGISADDIDQIFNPYFTTKDVGKGSGMGLSVVHGIVKEHNGMITVESELGKGTTFSIFLPIVKQEAVVDIETDEELPVGNEKILFIDDEESIVELGRQGLQRLGYSVEATTSPIKALKLFQSKPNDFDLVITDMTMPDMNGDKLVREILSIRSDIPIILCTGFSEKVDESRAKMIGVAGYIEKPLDKRDFAFKVRKVLNAARNSDGHF